MAMSLCLPNIDADVDWYAIAHLDATSDSVLSGQYNMMSMSCGVYPGLEEPLTAEEIAAEEEARVAAEHAAVADYEATKEYQVPGQITPTGHGDYDEDFVPLEHHEHSHKSHALPGAKRTLETSVLRPKTS